MATDPPVLPPWGVPGLGPNPGPWQPLSRILGRQDRASWAGRAGLRAQPLGELYSASAPSRWWQKETHRQGPFDG